MEIKLGQDVPAYTPFSLKLTALSHGWVNLQPFTWDGTQLSWIQRGKRRAYRVNVIQKSKNLLSITTQASPALDFEERSVLRQTVIRILNLNLDLRDFSVLARKLDKRVARFLSAGGGRLLRGASTFEDLVKTLCTTNASWAHTTNQVENLIRHYGQEGTEGHAFPAVEDFKKVGERDLREKCRMGYRAAYLLNLIKKCHGSSTNQGDDGNSLLKNRLLGFGPYAIAHSKVLLNDFSEIPWDSEVSGYVREYLRIRKDTEQKAKNALDKRLSQWGSWKFLAFKCGRRILKANWIGD